MKLARRRPIGRRDFVVQRSGTDTRAMMSGSRNRISLTRAASPGRMAPQKANCLAWVIIGPVAGGIGIQAVLQGDCVNQY